MFANIAICERSFGIYVIDRAGRETYLQNALFKRTYVWKSLQAISWGELEDDVYIHYTFLVPTREIVVRRYQVPIVYRYGGVS